MPLQATDIALAFEGQFSDRPQWIVRAPGRVNLIGEHTDYNDGFVLPLAIDRAVWIAARPRTDDQVVIWSVDFQERAAFSVEQLEKGPAEWIEYFKGVAWSLKQDGHALAGWEGVVQGDVPLGAGLSSSAALEMAVARTFAAVGNLVWDEVPMALACQRAENRWVGMNCGIMDQLISAVGRAGQAVLIDCRTLELQNVPLPLGTAVVVLDTGTRRGLVDSEYNQRRAQCEMAARRFGVKALRDLDSQRLASRAGELDPATLRRARHVISENERTVEAAAAMRRGDAVRLGQLMNESHRSLRDDFEVSSPALDAMVDAARRQPGCFGARMTGAGFGGCAVALVEIGRADAFASAAGLEYQQATQTRPAVYVCQATQGASIEG